MKMEAKQDIIAISSKSVDDKDDVWVALNPEVDSDELFEIDDSQDFSDSKESSRSTEKVYSKIFVFWSLIGAVLLALSSVIRGIESAEPFAAKFTLSLAYLVLSLLTVGYKKWRHGAKFSAPWYY